MKKVHCLENDTPILPEVIADTVIRELAYYLERSGHTIELLIEPASNTLADKLADMARTLYRTNARFRNKIRSARGNSGRDFLYMFMRHWLASTCRKSGVSGIPDSFARGLELPVRPN